ncbi:MAG TPA: PAS domain-containing protein [Terriglobales bacterium]|nr:PAS domain-containing protein [Terriglobales bacterium]
MAAFDAEAFAAQIRHPHLQRFFAYWRDKAAGREMPTRNDLDPIDFRYVLGNVILVDVEREPLRFRFRLYGARLINFFRDGDYTGKYADQLLPPDYAPFVVKAYTVAVEGRVPRYAERDLVMNQQRIVYDVLTLPLADPADPGTIAMLAVAMLPIDRKMLG